MTLFYPHEKPKKWDWWDATGTDLTEENSTPFWEIWMCWIWKWSKLKNKSRIQKSSEWTMTNDNDQWQWPMTIPKWDYMFISPWIDIYKCRHPHHRPNMETQKKMFSWICLVFTHINVKHSIINLRNTRDCCVRRVSHWDVIINRHVDSFGVSYPTFWVFFGFHHVFTMMEATAIYSNYVWISIPLVGMIYIYGYIHIKSM
jgi:hypothetical protein